MILMKMHLRNLKPIQVCDGLRRMCTTTTGEKSKSGHTAKSAPGLSSKVVVVSTGAQRNASSQLQRQKSSPQIGSTAGLETPLPRSRTPPPVFDPTPANVGTTFVPRKLVQYPASSSYVPRCRVPANATRSAENLAHRLPVKCVKETVSKSDCLDLAYNSYLQSCLMVAHAQSARQANEQKIAMDLENLYVKLMTMDEKIHTLNVSVEKVRFFKEMKEIIIKRIEGYQAVIDSTDEKNLDEQIKILDDELNVIRMNDFELPETDKDTQSVLTSLRDIAKELKAMPALEEKIQPLGQLYASLQKTKEDIQKEETLKNICERKLKKAEALLYHELYLRSVVLKKK